jgi:tetratricopeptide (TPR) repeat protein
LLAGFFAQTAQASALGEWCEQQWEITTNNVAVEFDASYRDAIAQWEKLAGKCSGTIAYEARLATIYALANEPVKARRVLQGIAGKESEYGYLAEMAQLQVETSEALATGTSPEKKDKLEGVARKYVTFVKKYPRWPTGYAVLGGLQTTLGQHQAAVRTLMAGIEVTDKEKRASPNLWGVYRNLTISYAALGEYRTALDAGDIAYEMKKGISSDQYFMYAMARAYAGVGNFQAAQNALNLILAKKPEVRGDPEFVDTVNFAAARARAGKNNK